jgi:ketosteroid isomerase-like protein
VSESNVDVFRRALEALDRRDRETWIALHDPRADVLPSRTFPEADVIRGPEPCWDFYVAVMEPFEHVSAGEAVQVEDLGHNQVLAHQRTEVRGRASGAPVELDYWVLSTFRDGRVLRDEWFLTEEEARAAAGG